LTVGHERGQDEGVSRLKPLGGLLAVLGAVVLIFLFLPLGSALQFGGDEGYQLITGSMMSKGFILYKQIWYDQPPLFVLLLNWGFKMCGPSILFARLMAAGFGLLLVGALYQTVKLRLGQWAAVLATFLLMASPGVLELSVSVMQEVPAFALVLLSALLLFQWRRSPRLGWLLASGGVFGLAAEVKFTALLVAPAMIGEIWLAACDNREGKRLNRFIRAVVGWSIVGMLTCSAITLLWARSSFQPMYRAHFAVHAVEGMPRPEDFPLQLGVFTDHAEVVVAAVVGVALVLHRRRLRDFTFPGIWLATVLAVHTIHRPWWMYYYLHWAIPMAWFAAFALDEVRKACWRIFSTTGLDLAKRRSWQGLGLFTLAALTAVRSERRLELGMKDLRRRERVDASPLVAKLRQCANQTHWVYVQYTKEAYAFHAQLLVPPELAVVSLKRYWSGEISTEEIVALCECYRPEQVHLSAGARDTAWQDILKDYTAVSQAAGLTLYQLRQVQMSHNL
jgi:4-amino-4-deoxy-L-arabinose transferase-like glycosyltransferase